MKFKYKQPVQIFLIFEKINSFFWNSKKLTINHNIIILPRNWIYPINLFIRNELFLAFNQLVELSIIDTSNYSSKSLNTSNKYNYIFNNSNIIFYHYFNFYLKTKITILYLLNNNKFKINSIDRIFSNANWLEREASEMYGLNFTWKQDTRKLLLDYTKLEYPMLKNYQSEGNQDVFYNMINNQVIVLKNSTIEL